MTLLRQPAWIIAADRHPHIQFIIESLNPAPEVHAPKFVFTGNIPQRLEWNGDLNRPTVSGYNTLRFKNKIGIEVFVVVRPGAVSLDAQRIEIEFVRLALIVECVEENSDVIIVEDAV